MKIVVIGGSGRGAEHWREQHHGGGTTSTRNLLAADATLFAREDFVEEAWRIVNPVRRAGTPVYEYEPGTWGPEESGSIVPAGGWHDPILQAAKNTQTAA